MQINIHNQCLGFRLLRSEFFSRGIDWNVRPDWGMNPGDMKSIGLKSPLAVFEGVLMCELKREHFEIGLLSNATDIRLLVSWKSEGYGKFCVHVHLIDYSGYTNWSTAQLKGYYQRYAHQLRAYTGPLEDTWLTRNDTVFMTRLELNFTQRDGVLNITVSEGVENEHTRKPVWINPRIFDKEMMRVTIRNLYPGLELTSPVYFSTGTTCHLSPSRQVDIGTIIEASFGRGFNQKDVKGAVLYKLQRKCVGRINNQSNGSTATNAHLFVAWEVGEGMHRLRVCLIECADDFDWDEDKLWAFYDQHGHRIDERHRTSRTSWMLDDSEEPDRITWLMHDGSVIKTKFDIAYESDYKLDIVISEGTRKYELSKPIQIGPKRSVLLCSILTC
jgi:hypothetical protein